MINDEQLEKILRNDTAVNVDKEVADIWAAANIMRGTIKAERYKDIVLPMFIIRRLECSLANTKQAVLSACSQKPDMPAAALEHITQHNYYNTSKWDLLSLLTAPTAIAANFKDYINHFSQNVQEIISVFKFEQNIDKLDEAGKLYPLIQRFSTLPYAPSQMDSIKAGYLLEMTLRKFGEGSILTGEHYTSREIIELMLALAVSTNADDILTKPNKLVSVLDLACGTGGMLSTSHSALLRVNPKLKFSLCGQEIIDESWAICSMEMLIRGLDSSDIVNGDSLMTNPFSRRRFRLVLMNPPFGVSWDGEDAPYGCGNAVRAEAAKENGRFPAGLPATSDAQLLFLQAGFAALEDDGKMVIVENGSPLFSGNIGSGDSKIRKWLIENDYLEAVIQLPAELFANTGITTYLFVCSKNKEKKRQGKLQLIDGSQCFHKLRKAIGDKRNTLEYEDKLAIVKEYLAFKDSTITKILPNEYFYLREYSVYQPLQRRYEITNESIEALIESGKLKSIHDPAFMAKVEAQIEEALNDPSKKVNAKDKSKYDDYVNITPIYEAIIATLQSNAPSAAYTDPTEFGKYLLPLFVDADADILALVKKMKKNFVDGLSTMDKDAPIQTDKKGNVLFDKTTKDTEIVTGVEDIETYLDREVRPFISDILYDESYNDGAEIPFTRLFYKYQDVEAPEVIAARVTARSAEIAEHMNKLFNE